MPENEKEIPISAGQAAVEFANDNDNNDPSKKEEIMQDSKPSQNYTPVDSAPVAKKSSGTGWKVATFVFLILTLCGAGFCTYLIAVKDNPITGTNNDAVSSQKKCTEEKEATTPSDSNDSGDIADSTVTKDESGNVKFKFLKSGFVLNLGSDFETINYEYSSEPTGAIERLYIGGLSKNTTGAQNYPEFAIGDNNNGAEGGHSWANLAVVTVYTKASYESISANGVASPATKVWENGDYVVTYSHPQNIISTDDWSKQWEEATVQALETAIKNEANWSAE